VLALIYFAGSVGFLCDIWLREFLGCKPEFLLIVLHNSSFQLQVFQAYYQQKLLHHSSPSEMSALFVVLLFLWQIKPFRLKIVDWVDAGLSLT
jgi:hypothetical protein